MFLLAVIGNPPALSVWTNAWLQPSIHAGMVTENERPSKGGNLHDSITVRRPLRHSSRSSEGLHLHRGGQVRARTISLRG